MVGQLFPVLPTPDGHLGALAGKQISQRNQHENNDKLISVENDCNEYIIYHPYSYWSLQLSELQVILVGTQVNQGVGLVWRCEGNP